MRTDEAYEKATELIVFEFCPDTYSNIAMNCHVTSDKISIKRFGIKQLKQKII